MDHHHNANEITVIHVHSVNYRSAGFVSFGCGVGPYIHPTIHACMHPLVMLLKGHACTAGVMAFGSMHAQPQPHSTATATAK